MVAAALVAAADWWAVERDNLRVEYVAKPATTALILFAALAVHPACPGERIAVVIALALCLAGDVFLMLPSDQFVPGLASFLVGHVAFVVGFVLGRGHRPLFALTVPLAIVAIGASARPVLRGAAAQDPALRLPVLAYMSVIGAMLVFSALPSNRVAIAGAAVFVLSDSILARDRFVARLNQGRLLTMVTYHAALALIVLSLL